MLLFLFIFLKAARILQFPSYSLAYLIQSHCKITVDKQYQLADWRKRPLSKEMIQYAREDTHYLLYIFDNLRRQLLARGMLNHFNDKFRLIKDVINRSKQVANGVYEKTPFKDYEYYAIIQRNLSIFGVHQNYVLKALLKWRFINYSFLIL
jgi:exosome complex exonuclease RRP6